MATAKVRNGPSHSGNGLLCPSPKIVCCFLLKNKHNYSSPSMTTASTTRTMMVKVSQMAKKGPTTRTGAGDGLHSPSPNIVCFLLNMLCIYLLKSTIPTGPDNPTNEHQNHPTLGGFGTSLHDSRQPPQAPTPLHDPRQPLKSSAMLGLGGF